MTAFRVAVTGLGAVASVGHDAASVWSALQRGAVGIGPITTVPATRLQTAIAAEVVGFDAGAHFAPKQLSGLDRAAQFALVAARQAMHAVASASFDPLRAGCVLGAAVGHETLDDGYRAFYGEQAKRLPPLTVPRVMPSGPVSHISIAYGLRGASFAVASACASAAHAIGLAFQMIRAGVLDLVVTGGTEASIQPGYIKAWEGLRVLTADACRPFSRDRSGLVLGEGAGVLVLERLAHAQARGAVILAEIVGFGMTADAADMTAPDAGGAARAMQAALDDAGLAADEVDYVNAHGTGTRLNDRTETLALRQVFGAGLDRIAVSSSKSMLGHTLNAAGGLEAVATVLALRDGVLPPTAGFREADPDCAVDCVPNTARVAAIRTALSNSFAFGGLNAVLAFRRAA